MHKVIAPVSGKGGVGKTSLTIGLAGAAAADCDQTVIVVDLDQGHGATDVLGTDHPAGLSVIDAGQGRPVVDCLVPSTTFVETGDRIRVLRGVEEIERFPLSERSLRYIVDQCRELADLVLIDTQNFAAAMLPVLNVADRIFLPAFLDGLSLTAPEVILGRAIEMGALDKIGGIVLNRVERRPSMGLQTTIDYYVENGYAYSARVREGAKWKAMLLGTWLVGDAADEAVALYKAIQTHQPETEALRGLARTPAPSRAAGRTAFA